MSCEVAVIGAGITGALMAWHLADAGIDTIVLDRREAAHGSTAGSTARLQYEIDTPLGKLERQLGPARARRAYHGCLGAVQRISRLAKQLRIDCGFESKGSLLLAHNRTHVAALRREFHARQAAGFDVEFAYGLLAAANRKGAAVHDRTAVVRHRTTTRAPGSRWATGATASPTVCSPRNSFASA